MQDDEYWRDKLSPEEFQVCRNKGTEPAFSGEYWDTKQDGIYNCRCCGEPLFMSDTKFDSGCGWPSFFKPADAQVVEEHRDTTHGMIRTEVTCKNVVPILGMSSKTGQTLQDCATVSTVCRCAWKRAEGPAVNEATLALYREALISQKAAIEELQAAGKSATDTVELDQSMVGRLSRMDALQAQQMAQETARRRQCQLLRIESALRRVDSGDFGYCLTCGDEIVVGRLEFDPTSDRCVGCVDV